MPHSPGDFKFGCPVFSSDEKLVGKLENILVDDERFEVEQISVSESAIASGHHWYQGANMLTRDLVVPASAIAAANERKIKLTIPLSQVRQLPPLIKETFIGVSPAAMVGGLVGLGTPWPYTEKEQLPASHELVVHKGENVITEGSDDLLGHVEELVSDDTGQLVAVVIKPTAFFSHPVLLQTRFLARGNDEVLFARINKAAMSRLEPFKPSDNEAS